jgi:glycosyltransferase involved in cell wall biosynthesis
MNYVDVIIPTRNRAKKLGATLSTIPREAAGKPVRIVLVFDADEETADLFKKDLRIAKIIVTPKHIGSVASRNLATAKAEDAVLMAVDDIVFRPGAVDAAVRAFEERFPDDDGVVGFFQEGTDHFSPTGVPLVGQAFLRRYPGKRLYWPGYYHFACQEIDRLASSLGKLWLEPKARLFHFHPSTGHGPRDRTHDDARVFSRRDHDLSRKRKAANETWGAS